MNTDTNMNGTTEICDFLERNDPSPSKKIGNTYCTYVRGNSPLISLRNEEDFPVDKELLKGFLEHEVNIRQLSIIASTEQLDGWLEVVKNVGQALEVINLRNFEISNTTMELLVETIMKLPNLKELNMLGCAFDNDTCVSRLFETYGHNKALKKFYLSGINIYETNPVDGETNLYGFPGVADRLNIGDGLQKTLMEILVRNPTAKIICRNAEITKFSNKSAQDRLDISKSMTPSTMRKSARNVVNSENC